jgi:undecaprenyl-diphosphatase
MRSSARNQMTNEPLPVPTDRKNALKKVFAAEFIVLYSLILISLLFFYSLIHSVIPEKQNMIDSEAFRYFHPFISDNHTRLASFITFFGTGTFLIPSYMFILFYLIRLNYHKYALMVLTMVVSSLFLGWLLKPTFHRIRPPYPLVSGAGGYSFPSGHALGAFIFAGVLIYLVWNTRKRIVVKCVLSLLLISFAMLVALSRIYLHVHYATDIAGSFFIALTWLSLIYLFFSFLYSHSLHEKKVRSASNSDAAAGELQFLNQAE